MGKRYQSSPPRRLRGGGGSQPVRGARLTPQFPVMTVVTPWLTLQAIPGSERTARSSWVWASMKPGETTRPLASISRSPRIASSRPTAKIRSPSTATSATRRGAPVPSTTVPPRRSSSHALEFIRLDLLVWGRESRFGTGLCIATRPLPPPRYKPPSKGRSRDQGLRRRLPSRRRFHRHPGRTARLMERQRHDRGLGGLRSGGTSSIWAARMDRNQPCANFTSCMSLGSPAGPLGANRGARRDAGIVGHLTAALAAAALTRRARARSRAGWSRSGGTAAGLPPRGARRTPSGSRSGQRRAAGAGGSVPGVDRGR